MGALLFLTLALTVSTYAFTPPALYIDSLMPSWGATSGGEMVTLQGRGFSSPVRVFVGGKEAFVVSVRDTDVVIVTPAMPAEAADVAVRVVVNAGTTDERTVVAPMPFRYTTDAQPLLFAISPNAGPPAGGTRATIFGDFLLAPLQVFFGASEAQVISVSFNQVVVIVPPAANGTTVDITLIDFASNKTVTLAAAYRYQSAGRMRAVGH